MKRIQILGVLLIFAISILTACSTPAKESGSEDGRFTSTTDIDAATSITSVTNQGEQSANSNSTTGRVSSTTGTQKNEADAGDLFDTTTRLGGDQVTTTTKTNSGGQTSGSTTTTKNNGGQTSGSTTTTTTKKNGGQTSGSAQAEEVLLPQNGYDLDGKGRILVQSSSRSGVIVSLKLKNVTSKWMIDETSSIEMTCYDANGNEVKTERVIIGALEAGQEKTITLEMTIDTTEIKITDFQADYWTQWV